MKLRILVLIFSLLLGLYLFASVVLYLFQQKIVFQPKKLVGDYRFEFEYPFEEFWIQTADQEKINALLFKTQQSKKGLVLYFHGNRGHLQRWAAYHKDFTSRGYDFLAIDYRGYGKSTGKQSEEGLYQDALAAYHWAMEHYPEQEIIIYGRSLGSGVASYLATQVTTAKMLILETPYHSIPGVFKMKASFLPIPFKVKTQFPNEEYLKQVTMPIYIFHGTKDRIIPLRSAQKLAPLLANEEHFITIEKGKHKNLNTFPLYHQELDQLLQ